MAAPGAGDTVQIVPVPWALGLTNAKSDTGVGLTASATSGAMGISRTAGTKLVLVGETTSASAVTDKALFEISLPGNYVPGTDLTVDVNCNYTGSGTVTAASTTMAVNAYSEVAGVETALTVASAKQIPSTAGDLLFDVTGTNLLPGQRVVIELVMLVTTSAGAATGQVNAVSYSASEWQQE